MTATSIDPKPTSSATSDPVHRAGAVTAVAGGVVLAASLLVSPGPDISQVHDAAWVPGHAISALGYLLLALGLPAIATSLGRRLGIAGAIGYVALIVRCVLSTGSHLYSMWIMPTLAKYPHLHGRLQHDDPLGTIYAGHGDAIDLVIAVCLLGLAYSLWRCGRGMRAVAVMIFLSAAFQAVGLPFALLMWAGVAIWLGLRLLLRGDVTTQLRTR